MNIIPITREPTIGDIICVFQSADEMERGIVTRVWESDTISEFFYFEIEWLDGTRVKDCYYKGTVHQDMYFCCTKEYIRKY